MKWTHVAWIILGVACSYSWSTSAASGFNAFWYLFHINSCCKEKYFLVSGHLASRRKQEMTVLFLKSLCWPDREDTMTCHQVWVLHTKFPRLNFQGFHLFHSPFISNVTRLSVKVTSVLYQLKYTSVFVSHKYTVTHWKHAGLQSL